MTIEGIVTKALGGFYYVAVEDTIYETTLRGRLKRDEKIVVGDRVKLKSLGQSRAVLEHLVPRTSLLFRPPVSNVDNVIIVFAATHPEPHFLHLDRMTVLGEYSGLHVVICCNKSDLSLSANTKDKFERYREIGYPVIFTSTKTGDGLPDLDRMLKGRISVFSGPSGAGKSSLLNALQPGLRLKTGELSAKIERGKHTTRHIELLVYGKDGFVVDTPGFGNAQISGISPQQLSSFFIEFNYYTQCKFQDCQHWSEPHCHVKKAVEKGQIDKERYENYITLLQEAREGEKKW